MTAAQPERLRSRLAEAARVIETEVGRRSLSDGRCKLCNAAPGEPHYADDSQPCAFAVIERVLSDLAELAAEREPAGWEAVEGATAAVLSCIGWVSTGNDGQVVNVCRGDHCDDCPARYQAAVLAAIKPLWFTPGGTP